MKQLACELCGGSDLVKTDGVFVCQSCGTKYSVEEAKKMMVEISGTIIINESEKIEKLYELARISIKNRNYESAEKHFDSILQNEPTSWEALFYNVYSSAMRTNIANITSAAYSVINTLDSVLSSVNDLPNMYEKTNVINELYDKLKELTMILSVSAQNFYNDIEYTVKSNYRKETVERIKAAGMILFIFGDKLVSHFPKRITMNKIAINSWEFGLEVLSSGEQISDSADSSLFSLRFEYLNKKTEIELENIDIESKSSKDFWSKYPTENEVVVKQIKNLEYELLPSAQEIRNNYEIDLISVRLKLLMELWTKFRDEDEKLSDFEKNTIFDVEWESSRIEQHESFSRIRDARLKELKEIELEIENNQNLIRINQKLFGEQAKIRKSAQERIIELKTKIKDYSDLL